MGSLRKESSDVDHTIRKRLRTLIFALNVKGGVKATYSPTKVRASEHMNKAIWRYCWMRIKAADNLTGQRHDSVIAAVVREWQDKPTLEVHIIQSTFGQPLHILHVVVKGMDCSALLFNNSVQRLMGNYQQ
jgi:hypothetical protein